MSDLILKDRYSTQIDNSQYISRDLSWLKFNHRVLDQAKKEGRPLLDRLKFLAITASNADEFFMIRMGSLYNYLDYGKERVDLSGLKAIPFKRRLLSEFKIFTKEQTDYFVEHLLPELPKNGIKITHVENLQKKEQERVKNYFQKVVHPMLTPMVFDSFHTFPILVNNVLIFGVVTRSREEHEEKRKMSFIQIPTNLPRFYEIERNDTFYFVPIEDIVRTYIDSFFKNVEIISETLFRVTRNGDFTLEESEDLEANFIDELKSKLKTRKTGRVVRIEVEDKYDKWLIKQLKLRWELDEENVITVHKPGLMDYTGLWQIVKHPEFSHLCTPIPAPVQPVSISQDADENIFKILKRRDIMLHHPYNSFEPLMNLLEKAAEDPHVLSIKLTIYRLAKNSRIIEALLNAAENGKHVSVLFEVKARFDEENNMREAKRLQKAGCFVIYGVGLLKTHTKLMLIVRKEGEKVTRYVHLASGNYNEATARLYTDVGILSTNEVYASDVSEFFNAITGHSYPEKYENLITAPREMRNSLIELILNEAKNATSGLPSGIVIKINSLQDIDVINALYQASQAGVQIKLTVRGICCLRPGRAGLSENITVSSIVGEYLEHSRIFYFHNNGEPKVYAGSADIMVRSFDRRLESLFLINDPFLKKQAINILKFNQKDNYNKYVMQEDGSYEAVQPGENEPIFNIHKEFYRVTRDMIENASLF
ncbi:MAG: polyphosphate kinase 1 [Imperialibacter sp.]|uniref:polyphosphate kinase 1 n=2 Tax=Imperialibacter TaxID=1649461 RepID=UPI00125B0004|nr:MULTISPECIES: polyphosphate kinase 1 [unclassified Imperialibacter]CAD5281013.1 Polyphosphate kinase [Imperialibacter sp. 75]CAD5296341.1 Polyphosphate kinase [Imperialibacter sp. 89]VVT27776.1 Polyphosphate kinase [Imperialibacter sp. EC-SDR9]